MKLSRAHQEWALSITPEPGVSLECCRETQETEKENEYSYLPPVDRRHTGISRRELYQAREPGYSILVLQKGASIAPICHPACVSTGAIA